MKRQVIFLMTDTTRKDMVGCYGNEKMKTPNLDRLAAEGIRYENAYTCQPVCGPARSAIFTGTFPHTNGMVTNSIAMGDNVKTLGQRLSVSYDEPHGPSLCPSPFNHMYDGFKFDHNPSFQDDLSKKPFMQRLWAGKNIYASEDQINQASDGLSLFLGCNSFADYEIGRVLDKIREVAPDALVIFTSDHGDMLGAHRLFSKNAAAYKEVANIPLIIKGGAVGCVEEAPASHIDIAPTIMEYFGLPVPKLMEGKSMLSQIKDPSVKINDEVYTEFTRYEVDHDGFGGLQIMRAVTSDRYKLVIHLCDTDEFYDMQEDPYEIHNLIDDERYTEVRNELHDKLIAHMNDTRDLYRGYQWSMRSWRPDFVPNWENEGYTRQRENEEYEPRQLDYDTGLPMETAVRKKN